MTSVTHLMYVKILLLYTNKYHSFRVATRGDFKEKLALPPNLTSLDVFMTTEHRKEIFSVLPSLKYLQSLNLVFDVNYLQQDEAFHPDLIDQMADFCMKSIDALTSLTLDLIDMDESCRYNYFRNTNGDIQKWTSSCNVKRSWIQPGSIHVPKFDREKLESNLRQRAKNFEMERDREKEIRLKPKRPRQTACKTSSKPIRKS